MSGNRQGKKDTLAALSNRLSEAFPSLLHIADRNHPLPEVTRVLKVANIIYQDLSDIDQSKIGLRLAGKLLSDS